MTTYEGGVRVISLLRWPEVIKAGQVLNGIQAHMDMFTTFAAAAGVKDVAEKIKKEKNQYIDGVDNLDYWTGKSKESARTDFIYYRESKLMAIRVGPWKVHFATSENYYDLPKTRNPVFFNIRSDPFESYDSEDSYGHMAQRVSWLFQPISEIIQKHVATIKQYPPVQGGTGFQLDDVVIDLLKQMKSKE